MQQCFFKVNRVVFHIHCSVQSLTLPLATRCSVPGCYSSPETNLLLAMWRLFSHFDSSSSHHFQVPDSLQCPGVWVYSVLYFSHFVQSSTVHSGFVTKPRTTRSSSSVSCTQKVQIPVPLTFLTSNLYIVHVPLAITSYSALLTFGLLYTLNTYTSVISTSVQYRLCIFGYFLHAVLPVSDRSLVDHRHFAH